MDESEGAAMLAPYMSDLREIWAEIGLSEVQRERRAAVVRRHVTSLLTDMVSEERALKQELVEKAASRRQELGDLAEELGVGYDEPPTDCGMLSLVDWLTEQLKRLGVVKEERLGRMGQLQREEMALCETLAAEPYYIPSGTTPSEQQLAELQQHVTTLQSTKDERFAQYIAVRVRLRTILSTLGVTPSGSFEKELTCADTDTFMLSPSRLSEAESVLSRYEQKEHNARQEAKDLRRKLGSLWQRLDVPQSERDEFLHQHEGIEKATLTAMQQEVSRLEALKLENIQKIITRIRAELKDLWTKCYYSQEKIASFDSYMNDDEFTEDLLTCHEREVERVRAYYDKHEDLFLKIDKRRELWDSMLAFDRKEQDPNRYNNRGGNLLQEEKDRKQVLRQLPKIENQLKGAVDEWQMEHCDIFLMEGMEFEEYCQDQWKKYHENKEKEKALRIKNKEKEMQAELLYGSKAATPSKRRFCGVTTPAKTPKQRKMNDTTATPGSVSRRTPFTAVSINRTPQKDQPSTFASPALPSRKHPVRSARKNADRCPSRTPGQPSTDKKSPPKGTPKFHKPQTPKSARRGGGKTKGEPLLSAAPVSSEIAQLNQDETLPLAANYGEFKNGIHTADKVNFRSSTVDLRSSSKVWKC